MATTFGTASLASQSSLLQTNEDRVLNGLKYSQGSADDAKIEKGSKEFEAMLLSTWMQQAEQSMATVPGAEDDEDAAGREQMMSLGIQSVSKAMADSGGIGISQMLARAMHALADKESAQAAANTGDTEAVTVGK